MSDEQRPTASDDGDIAGHSAAATNPGEHDGVSTAHDSVYRAEPGTNGGVHSATRLGSNIPVERTALSPSIAPASHLVQPVDRIAPLISQQRTRRPGSTSRPTNTPDSWTQAGSGVDQIVSDAVQKTPDSNSPSPADASGDTDGTGSLAFEDMHTDPISASDVSSAAAFETTAQAAPVDTYSVTPHADEPNAQAEPLANPMNTGPSTTSPTGETVVTNGPAREVPIETHVEHADDAPVDAARYEGYVPYLPYKPTDETITIAQLAARIAETVPPLLEGTSNGSGTVGISVQQAQHMSPVANHPPDAVETAVQERAVEQPSVLDVPYTPPAVYGTAAAVSTIPEAADPNLATFSAVAPPAVPPTDTAIAASAPLPPPAQGDEEEGGTMTIIEHLEELRIRLMWCLGAIGLGSFAGWFLVPPAIAQMQAPLIAHGVPMVMLTAFGPFVLNIKLAFIFGTVMASPMILYQIWGFVAPGLTRNEKTYARPFVLLGSLLFVAGAATGFYIFPLGIAFALTFFPALNVTALIEADKYVSFIGWIMLVFGVTYELPVFLVFLSLIGVITSQGLAQRRKAAFVIIFIVATVITPGADFISPIIMGVILCTLYESSIWLARAVGR